MGNSRWRLETSINLALLNAKDANFLDKFEIVVSDWGSEIPLHEVLNLVPDAKDRVKFVHVPSDIAKVEQKDSKFPEVIALNAAARRANGEYIGRIDNDTVIGADFFRKFEQFYKNNPSKELDLADSFLFVERKSVPYRISRLSLPLPLTSFFIRMFSRFFKLESATDWGKEFWHSPVGIMIFHRDIWKATQGYDERLIYWGWMETDYAIRLSQRHHIINFGDHVGHHFFHLEHYSNLTEYKNRNGAATPRKKNEALTEGLTYIVNSNSWGLAKNDLTESAFSNSKASQVGSFSIISIVKLSIATLLVIKDKCSEFLLSFIPDLQVFLGKIKRVVLFLK
jgi:hypothetical protein